MVTQGLSALSIDDGGLDPRNSIERMAVLFRSAEKLGLDAVKLFAEAADLATNPFLKAAMLGFPARRPEDRDLLEAFYIREKTTDRGFSYEPWQYGAARRKVWWRKLRKFLGGSGRLQG